MLALLCLSVWPLAGQNSALSGAKPAVVGVTVKGPVTAKRGASVPVPVVVTVAKGYHVTSSDPGDRYLKPLRLSWDAGALEPGAPRYPKAVSRRYPFSEGKLSVFEGSFTIEQELRIPASAPQGFGSLTGKLYYQACTETECLPPATVPIRLSYDIR